MPPKKSQWWPPPHQHPQLLAGWKEEHNKEGQRDRGDDKQGCQGDNEGAGMTME